MKPRIAKKILTCKSSLHKNPKKVRIAKASLATLGLGEFISNAPECWDFILYS